MIHYNKLQAGKNNKKQITMIPSQQYEQQY